MATNHDLATSPADEHVDVAVVGAGLAGLTAAATAARQGDRVAVLSHGPPGGRAHTTERDGYRFNQGPHALYTGGAGMAVLRELGIEPTGGPPSTGEGRLLVDGELRQLPASAASLASSRWLSLRSRGQLATVLGRLGKWDLEELGHRSGADWLDDLGLRPDADAVLRTLARVTTYADDMASISADVVVGQLRQPNVRYLDGGWQQLVDALSGGLQPRTARATGLSRDGQGWLVTTDAGGVGAVRASAVVLAAGSPAACRALLPTDPGWGELGPASTAACLDLGLRRAPEPPIIFGADEPLYLSTHCPPADLAPAGGAVVQVMRYGARSAELDRPALHELARRAGITDDDVATQRFLAGMVTCSAVATPARGGLAGRPGMAATGAEGVYLAGDWVGPVGHLADASLASGRAAGAAAADLASRAQALAPILHSSSFELLSQSAASLNRPGAVQASGMATSLMKDQA
ncbi:MAG: NAD(P)-binding protein [Acidimicrobiia bacterium]|nr:NAD(P)-binding protein [Acidimicrobiia bacterium]